MKEEPEKANHLFEKNKTYEFEIDSYGNNGEGIGHPDGYTLFVKHAMAGEMVRVKATKIKKNYGYARLEEVLESSPERVKPKCPIANKCGGCDLQHMSYKAQLAFKKSQVYDCLTRLGGVDKSIKLEMLGYDGTEGAWNYRNKAQFPVGFDRDGGIVSGFYVARTHDIIPCEECYIQHPDINSVVKKIMDIIRAEGDASLVYDEKKHTGWLRHIFLRRSETTGELLVCLVVTDRDKQKKTTEKITKELTEKYSDKIKGICLNINPDETNVILGEEFITLFGDTCIEDAVGDVRYDISLQSFYQVNPYMTKKLYDKAAEYAGLDGTQTVWDLYCGVGTIGLYMAGKASKIIGVESEPSAVIDAKNNAKKNGITNAEFICDSAENAASSLEKADVVVVDPPRKGCDERLIETIGNAHPDRIVYVSCDPATLSRDIKRLSEYGYELKKACVVDQFWQSRHVETVCLLSLADK
ncbi:MAG: 23S rRNA (uracil(1939)-C(5))-methyltransferase RlmD [Eubacterium sp.]|nr:23S rRNA (uracil(1939)-C(5))-methyltransferase RlmD [Eubacterium sp.]